MAIAYAIGIPGLVPLPPSPRHLASLFAVWRTNPGIIILKPSVTDVNGQRAKCWGGVGCVLKCYPCLLFVSSFHCPVFRPPVDPRIQERRDERAPRKRKPPASQEGVATLTCERVEADIGKLGEAPHQRVREEDVEIYESERV